MWTTRLFDAIDRLSVPVVMADPIVQPFASFLDYDEFTETINVAHMIDADDLSVCSRLPLFTGPTSCVHAQQHRVNVNIAIATVPY